MVQDALDDPEQVYVDITFYAKPIVFDQEVTTKKDTPVHILLEAENLYPPMLSWTITDPPENGTLSPAPNLTYTPNPNYTGEDSFQFKGNNGYVDSNIGTVSITITPPTDETTTTINCGDDNPTVTYGSSIVCVATVSRNSGFHTPGGLVEWTTDGDGSFTTNPCTLSGTAGSATCSVTYTPSAVGTGTHLITATYNGDPDFAGSSGNQPVTVNKANASCNVTPYNVPFDGNAHTAAGACTGIGGVPLTGLDLTGTTHTNAGSYPSDPWTFTDAAGNYNSASGTVSDVITKVNPSCSVTPYNVTYDGNPHTATGTCTGVGGASLTGLVLSGTTHTNAGSYPGDPWTFTDTTGNYNNASGTVSDVITKANAICTVIPYNVPFDNKPHTATGACKGVGDVVLAGLNLTGTTHTNVGIYANDPWTFTDLTGNYNSTSGTITDTIFDYLIYLPLTFR
jgi:hypothetical protein